MKGILRRRRPSARKCRRGSRVACFLLFLLMAGHCPALAQTGNILEPDEDFNKGGRTAFQFLKIGIGARQVAMGEASVAVVEDVNAAFWNPAGIAGIQSMEAAFSYNRWLADINYTGAAVGARWDGVGLFAANIAFMDYGSIPEAKVTGSSGTNDPRTGQTFSGSDMLFGLTYAREFTDRLAIGVSAKYIRESLFDYAVGTTAFDVGTRYNTGFNGTRLAMSAQNFAGSVRWLEEARSDRREGYDIPLLFRIGLSTNLIGSQDAFFNAGAMHRLVVSAEAVNSNDYSERLHFGGEYYFTDLLILRAGYRMNYAEGNWSMGFGLNPQLGGINVRVDYAYVQYQYLSAPHRITMTLAF